MAEEKAKSLLAAAQSCNAENTVPTQYAAVSAAIENGERLRAGGQMKDALVAYQDAIRDANELIVSAQKEYLQTLELRLRRLDPKIARQTDEKAYDELYAVMKRLPNFVGVAPKRGEHTGPMIEDAKHADRLLARLEAQVTTGTVSAPPSSPH